MSISGNLEDLPFIDVIQLLHVARKSGTLWLSSEAGRAAIVCREGDIIGANHPSSEVYLGKILTDMDMVTRAQLDEAISLMERQEGHERKPLMSTLIGLGHLKKKEGWEALKLLIHRTMAEIISWKTGTFHFEINKISIDDDFRHVPDDIFEEGGVDIKGALMEALRIFDERNREQIERVKEEHKKRENEKIKEETRRKPIESDDDVPIREEPEDTFNVHVGRSREAVFMCTDSFLKYTIKTICKQERILCYVSGVGREIVREIEQCNTEGTDTVLVVDLSNDHKPGLRPKKLLQVVKRIKYLRPELPIVVLTSVLNPEVYRQSFAVGARTVLHKPVLGDADQAAYVEEMKKFFPVLTACVKSIFKDNNELQRSAQDSRMQIASLKRRVLEIQDRKTSPDVSLVVLQYIAEYLERGIIFLVRKKDLLGIGSFGVDAKGDTISTAAMRLKIPLDEISIFRKVVKSGMVFQGATEDPMVEKILFQSIGAPNSNFVLILPLKTENRTRALVYGDFGRREAEPVKIDVFEILASQAGMAIEIALQRNRLARHTEDLPLSPTSIAHET